MRQLATTIEPEEIFPDAVNRDAGEPLPGLGHLEWTLKARIVWFAWALALASCVFFLWVTLDVSIFQRHLYAAEAQANRLRTFSYGSARGIIVDRFGEPLAANRPRFSLVVFPRQLPVERAAYEALWHRVAGLVDGPAHLFEHFARAARESAQPFRLPLTLTFEEATEVERSAEAFPGIVALKEEQRSYPLEKVLSHVVGYVSEGERAGIEARYDALLAGKDGAALWEEDARGGARRIVEVRKPEVGKGLELTIDAALQRVSTEILTRHITPLGLKRAALVALEPTTGEILALVSLPAYSSTALQEGLSPAEFALLRDDADHPFFNRAIAGLYPPGSTIKPFLAAAALQENIIDPAKTIFVTGAIEVRHPQNPEIRYVFHDWRAHGAVDMVRAIAVSSNVYFYTVGGGYGSQEGLGIVRMEKYLRRFGFGRSLGIDIGGEQAGRIPTPDWKERLRGEAWYVGDTYNTAIGQGDTMVTPLQVAAATAVIANGGTLWQPRLLRRVIGDEAGERVRTPTMLEPEVLPRARFDIPRRGMRLAVTEGSGRALAGLTVPVAGKTGTAQSGRGTAHAWFTGFAPYENPEIVLTLVVEDGGEGSIVAVPIAREIFQWWAEHRLGQGG